MRKNPNRAVLRRASLSVALSLCVATAAFAQSNASGTIFGSGEPGATVVIESTETGFARQIAVDSAGRYRVPQLPVGNYRVTLQKNGQAVATQENVSVKLGAGSEVSFATGNAGAAQNLDAVIVTASSASPIDVSTTDTRVVFTAEQLQKISVGHNIQALALLTPGVVQGDSRYGNVQSFGGSAASENAFYINGYAVTNPLTNLGSTTLPFNGISQYQAFIGGYGAEFGRATGGVVNIITQRGTNEWKGGVMATWSPKNLRSTQRDIIYPSVGTANDGLIQQKLSERTVDEKLYGAYVGGPIIKDRLFVYAAGEFTDRGVDTVNVRGTAANTTAQDISVEIPRWLVKVDWNITDNHLLEFTGVSDTTKDSRDYFRFPYTGADAFQKGNTKNGGYYYEDGGELYIAKYTGYLTDNLTVSALYGEQEQDHIALPWGYDPSLVHVSDARPGSNPVTGLQAYDQLDIADAYDKTSGGRFDLDWRVGSHTLRLGYDRQDSESKAGEATSGPGYRWNYNTVGANPGIPTIPGSGGAVVPGGNGDYVMRYVYGNGGTFEVKQYAYYLEDRWQVNDRWLVTLGLRNENFENYNADGIVYVEQKDQWAPRLGVAWDVNGDSSLKLFANAGRYHLAMPNNVARRAAAGSLYTIEYFAFNGINPTTGEPLGLTPLGNGPYSSNQEYGNAPNPLTVAAKDLKSHFQDEFVLGFEKTLGESHNFGARYVYRDLKSAIDDVCDFRPARNWGLANGYSQADADALGDSLNHCRLFNPGEGNTFTLEDASGNLVEVPVSAAELGFPKLKRVYQGVDVFVERPFDGTWYYRVDYTWSKNYGNAEGQLKSDVGQMDVSMTMDWDHPELMEGANGNLPNDRRHYVKAYGFLQYNPEWRFSATFTANSGRPKNCTGIYAGDSLNVNDEFRDAVEYSGPYYYFCNGESSSRGSQGRLPWSAKLDLGVAYAPSFADEKLQFAVDVFNVTNSQSAQSVIEYGEIGAPGNPYHSTHRPLNYQAPRSVRFSVRYDF